MSRIHWIQFASFWEKIQKIGNKGKYPKTSFFDELASMMSDFELDHHERECLYSQFCKSQIEEQLQLQSILVKLIYQYSGVSPTWHKELEIRSTGELQNTIDDLIELLDNQDLSNKFAQVLGFSFLLDLTLDKVRKFNLKIADRSLCAMQETRPREGVAVLTDSRKIFFLETIVNYSQNNPKILRYFKLPDWRYLARYISSRLCAVETIRREMISALLVLFRVVTSCDKQKRIDFIKVGSDQAELEPNQGRSKIEQMRPIFQNGRKAIISSQLVTTIESTLPERPSEAEELPTKALNCPDPISENSNRLGAEIGASSDLRLNHSMRSEVDIFRKMRKSKRKRDLLTVQMSYTPN